MFTTAANLHDLPAEGRLFIFGAGAAGRALAAVLSREGRMIAGFLDSFRSDLTASPPIILFDDYPARRRPDDTVVICSDYAAEIRDRLQSRDIPAFDCSSIAAGLVGEQRRLLDVLDDGRFLLSAGG